MFVVDAAPEFATSGMSNSDIPTEIQTTEQPIEVLSIPMIFLLTG